MTDSAQTPKFLSVVWNIVDYPNVMMMIQWLINMFNIDIHSSVYYVELIQTFSHIFSFMWSVTPPTLIN